MYLSSVTFLWATLIFATFTTSQILQNTGFPLGTHFGIAGEDASFDYVIVGGGTAGLPLATRLAQDGRFSVAVVEAGGFYELEYGNRSVIPGYDFYSSGLFNLDGVDPRIDWMFLTTEQANGRAFHYPRGKCFGGSSARNYLVYQRPTKGTMQAWADAVNDQSWTWENVLPHYRNSATLTPPHTDLRSADAAPLYDSDAFSDGPLQVSYAHYSSPLAPSIVKAFNEIGDPLRKDGFQSGELLGHGYLPTSIDPKTQERSTSQSSYGRLALQSTKLTFYTHALVKKILFSNDKVATGVTVDSNGVEYTISAKREVILSAGAFQSPQLLMVSGIGPAKTLKKHNIKVVKDLAGVGQNMMDHPMFGMSFAATTETSQTFLTDPEYNAKAIAEYNEHRTGFLTSSGADVISFQRLLDLPDVELGPKTREALAGVPADAPDSMIWMFPFWQGPYLGSMPPDLKNYASFFGGLIAPMSRGSVTINSSDMADKPIIDPNILTHPADREMAVALMKRIRQLFATNALKGVSTGGEAYPGPEVTSDEDLLKVAIGQGATFSHASCTCKMGTADDSMAVVDSKARVFGVRNLRVVDISAMPFLPPGQPQASVYMLGEKIAHEILHGETPPSGSSAGSKHDEL